MQLGIRLEGFQSSMGFRKWKVIILDESDYLTPNAQQHFVI